MDIEFYTVEEVAYIMNLSEQTIRKMIKDKRIFAIKIGRTYRIPNDSIKYLKQSKM